MSGATFFTCLGFPNVNGNITFTSGSSAFYIPYFTKHLQIILDGAGGGGATAGDASSSLNNNGAGGSARCSSLYSISSSDWGKPLLWSVGALGAGGNGGPLQTPTSGSSGGDTTCTGTIAAGSINMTARGGGFGNVFSGGGGFGGTASGGNVANISGMDGGSAVAPAVSSPGGNAGSGANGGGPDESPPAQAPGGGGCSGGALFFNGSDGAAGQAFFHWYSP